MAHSNPHTGPPAYGIRLFVATVRAMQRTATRVFIASSLAFGLFGTAFFAYGFITDFDGDSGSDALFALWGISGCMVLVSFALSVAGKYLMDDS